MMEIKMGAFSNGYAWMLTDNDGQIIDQGWDENFVKAKQDAKDAEWFHRTHHYEIDNN